jgi:hypothetical protein
MQEDEAEGEPDDASPEGAEEAEKAKKAEDAEEEEAEEDADSAAGGESSASPSRASAARDASVAESEETSTSWLARGSGHTLVWQLADALRRHAQKYYGTEALANAAGARLGYLWRFPPRALVGFSTAMDTDGWDAAAELTFSRTDEDTWPTSGDLVLVLPPVETAEPDQREINVGRDHPAVRTHVKAVLFFPPCAILPLAPAALASLPCSTRLPRLPLRCAVLCALSQLQKDPRVDGPLTQMEDAKISRKAMRIRMLPGGRTARMEVVRCCCFYACCALLLRLC